MKSETGNT